VWSCIDEITKKYNVIHLCGNGKTNDKLKGKENYVQFEYIKKELASLLALADVVVSRAGANAICELLALRKPSVLIPLSLEASRGDQILNAQSFAKSGYAKLLMEEDVTDKSLLAAIDEVYDNRQDYIKAMDCSTTTDSITLITEMIEELAGK
jgi:UDP-N-acetylglucosamine--N-acetylmuramyl-(pentapeptide) pyrophosphoryl-undecaprenol N-acetylglucosamine transferase